MKLAGRKFGHHLLKLVTFPRFFPDKVVRFLKSAGFFRESLIKGKRLLEGEAYATLIRGQHFFETLKLLKEGNLKKNNIRDTP